MADLGLDAAQQRGIAAMFRAEGDCSFLLDEKFDIVVADTVDDGHARLPVQIVRSRGLKASLVRAPRDDESVLVGRG